MACAGAVAVLGGRPSAGWNALALAALVVLAGDPGALFEPGFALSFVAVVGILVWSPPRGGLAALVHATLAASCATAPLVAALGLPLPPQFLFANLLAVPYFGAVVLPLGLVAGGVGAFWPAAAAILGPLARGCAELGIQLVEGFGGGDLLEGHAAAVRVALAGAAGAFALRLLGTRRVRGAVGVVVGAALLAALLPRPSVDVGASLLALDVGQGDALLLRDGGQAWLVDAGPRWGRFDAGRAVIQPVLRAEGVARLEVLVLTHADRDHSGGAAAVLERVPVGEMWLSPQAYASPALEPLRRRAAARRIPLRLVVAGTQGRLGTLHLRVLWPPAALHTTSRNRGSVVLRVDGPHGCALLAGDVPADVEHRLAAREAPCEVLKLAHHGSRSSSDALWLARLRPWVALASAGHRRHAPLPHPEVLERLRAARVTLYATYRVGAIRVRFLPAGIVVEPHLVESRRWPDGPPESIPSSGVRSAIASGDGAT